MTNRKRIFSFLLAIVAVLSLLVIPAAPQAAAAEQESVSSKQIFYPIDMSEAVLASRINQRKQGDCAVVSMCTVESFLNGVTSDAEKEIIYDTLISKNGDNDYAYWYKCGFAAGSSMDWTAVYNQLAAGYPVLVHHPAVGRYRQHWAVVAGYIGSATTLEKDKFLIVDVNHGTGTGDIFTSGEWRMGSTIDRMVIRKNGIAFTELNGIRIAANHPKSVHIAGQSHGVYGTITSDSKLTSVQVMVTNAITGENLYSKTVTPDAVTYSVNNLNKEITFGKWPAGTYYYTIIAKTANDSKVVQKYFQIASGWPSKEPSHRYTFAIDLNGGTGEVPSMTVALGEHFSLPTEVPVRNGYLFKGWNLTRTTDGKLYTAQGQWHTATQIQNSGDALRLYTPGENHYLGYQWIMDCVYNDGYILTAVWEEEPPLLSPAPKPISGDTNNDGKVNLKDWAIIMEHINETTILTGDALENADVNGDGKVNIKDWACLYDLIITTDSI